MRTKIPINQLAQAVVSESEFKAGLLTTPFLQNISIVSFNHTTGLFVVSGVSLIGQSVKPQQYFRVTSGDASGTYVIVSVESETSFIVSGLEVTGTGGVGTIFEPPASNLLGVDTSNFQVLVSHSNLQSLLDDLDNKLLVLQSLAGVAPNIALAPSGSYTLMPATGQTTEVGAPAGRIDFNLG